MEITIDFTYPIQDSVSVGDVAYYVYTNGSGGFDINSANVVEIGEVLNINRFGVSGGNITCNTELYGNELEIGCGGCNCDVALNNHCGGCTCFEDFEVKPEPGKLIIFSNSQYLHYVSKVEGDERFVLSFWYNSLNK